MDQYVFILLGATTGCWTSLIQTWRGSGTAQINQVYEITMLILCTSTVVVCTIVFCVLPVPVLFFLPHFDSYGAHGLMTFCAFDCCQFHFIQKVNSWVHCCLNRIWIKQVTAEVLKWRRFFVEIYTMALMKPWSQFKRTRWTLVGVQLCETLQFHQAL